jgi:hypothetical protein
MRSLQATAISPWLFFALVGVSPTLRECINVGAHLAFFSDFLRPAMVDRATLALNGRQALFP